MPRATRTIPTMRLIRSTMWSSTSRQPSKRHSSLRERPRGHRRDSVSGSARHVTIGHLSRCLIWMRWTRRQRNRKVYQLADADRPSALRQTSWSWRGKRCDPRHESRRDPLATPTTPSRRLHRELSPTRPSRRLAGCLPVDYYPIHQRF
jgi:hypothetical protein